MPDDAALVEAMARAIAEEVCLGDGYDPNNYSIREAAKAALAAYRDAVAGGEG